MAVDRIDAEPEDLDAAFVELGLDLRHVAELRGAHRREILGVRKQHRPLVADPIVEADIALRRGRLEVGSCIAKRKCHVTPPDDAPPPVDPDGGHREKL
jgi:hypothetical protein